MNVSRPTGNYSATNESCHARGQPPFLVLRLRYSGEFLCSSIRLERETIFLTQSNTQKSHGDDAYRVKHDASKVLTAKTKVVTIVGRVAPSG